ncbi:MAG: enoyl-CoA hydratase-related protein [Xanthomonadales bacterium]|nr:enoyl-CoA hydratase-related protein [Xanthomonadales bacterium]
MSEPILIENLEGAVLTLTINRPDKLNALNASVMNALGAAISTAASNDEVRCVVLTGAGDKAFVAGADIAEIRAWDADAADDAIRRAHKLMRLMETMGKPVIAAINGYALGGGCELSMACTLRIASDNAVLGLPEITLGLIPGYGGTQRLTRLVGHGRALQMMLTGKPIDASTALDIGLVSQVVRPEELEATTMKLANRLANSAPRAVKAIIAAVDDGAHLGMAGALEVERQAFVGLIGSEDMLEGTAAFLEKRKPEFKGR